MSRLVEEGFSLARHYAYFVCAPSRASLLSGRFPHHLGNEINSVCNSLSPRYRTLARTLQLAGYRTHMVGKWHAGYFQAAATPRARGFETAVGFFGRQADYFSHCAAPPGGDACATAPSDPTRTPLVDFFTEDEGHSSYGNRAHPDVRNRTYATTLFTREAVRRVAEHDATSPFFLYLAYSAVHSPKQATDALLYRAQRQPAFTTGRDAMGLRRCGWLSAAGQHACTKEAQQSHRTIEAQALGVDDGIGELCDALRAKDMWPSTLLVLASDNGGTHASATTNSPLRGGKFSPFEGGVRVAAAVAGGWVPLALRGQTTNTFMHMADWLPTFAHVAGVAADDPAREPSVPGVDGQSAWPAWQAWLHALLQASEASSHGPQGHSLLTAALTATAGVVSRQMVLSSHALLDVRVRNGRVTAEKLLIGDVHSCFSGCGEPILKCGAKGCLYDVWNDPYETKAVTWDDEPRRAQLRAALEVALSTQWADRALEDAMHALVGCTSCYHDCISRMMDHAWLHGGSLLPWDADENEMEAREAATSLNYSTPIKRERV